MELIELLKQSDQWQDDATIYVARPWSSNAQAVLLRPSPDTTASVEQNGRRFDYFLEAFIARDFLDDFAASPDGSRVSEIQRCERLVRYAEEDA